ncbi:4828_t:CDS:2, partial [Dentiscutata heterogama]
LQSDLQFLQALQTVLSINLTQKKNCLAFDEALETLGAKFLKENITV